LRNPIYTNMKHLKRFNEKISNEVSVEEILQFLKPYAETPGEYTYGLVDLYFWDYKSELEVEFDVASNFREKSKVKRYLTKWGFQYAGSGLVSKKFENEEDIKKIKDFIDSL